MTWTWSSAEKDKKENSEKEGSDSFKDVEEETPSPHVVGLDDEANKPNETSSSPIWTPAWRQQPDSPREPVRCCDTRNKLILWGILGITLVVLAISLLATSLQSLESTEYGVQYNTHRKQLADAAKSGGLHAGPPGFEFIKFPSTFITVDLPEDTCVSKDGLRVQISVTFQYRLPSQWVVPVTIRYGNFDKWATLVEVAGKSAVQHACAEFNIVDFQNQRGLIQSTMEENLSIKLEGTDKDGVSGIYARAISLQLRNVNVPDEYRAAVQEKQTANEDIELAKSQRNQERTKAQTELLAAREEARKIMDTARNEAELLLTEARLKAEETLFAFQTEAETILRVKTNLNLSTDGVLAYMSNQLLSDVPSLTVTTAEPAKLSRKDEL